MNTTLMFLSSIIRSSLRVLNCSRNHLVFATLLCIFPVQQLLAASPGEIAALIALYKSTNGDSWRFHSNWLKGEDPCSGNWYGVSCRGGRVIELSLTGNNLSGRIPSEISGLVNLQVIYMYANKLIGPVPKELVQLPKLNYAMLHINYLYTDDPAVDARMRQLCGCNWAAYQKPPPKEPELAVSLSSRPLSDPVNGENNPKAIPGAIVEYTLTVANSGGNYQDRDSVVVVNRVPPGTALVIADTGGANSGPVRFIDGSPSSSLSYKYNALSSTTDDLSFSNDNGISFDYQPTPGVHGTDTSVTHFRVIPRGIFAPHTNGKDSFFQLSFRVRVK